MENNPAYGSAQKYTVSQTPTADDIYELDLVDLPATNEACADKKNTAAGDHEMPKVDKGRSIVGVIVAVLALVVAIAAITATVVLSQTDNSNQEIQSLQIEIKNLREMLNQTEDGLALLRTDNQARVHKNISSVHVYSMTCMHDYNERLHVIHVLYIIKKTMVNVKNCIQSV